MVNTSNSGLSPLWYNVFTSSFDSITFCLSSKFEVNSTFPLIQIHANSAVAVVISQLGFFSNSLYIGFLLLVQK